MSVPLRPTVARLADQNDQQLARLDLNLGSAEHRTINVDATIVGTASFWVAPGCDAVLSWQVDPKYKRSAWMRCPVTIVSRDGDHVTLRGGPFGPGTRPMGWGESK